MICCFMTFLAAAFLVGPSDKAAAGKGITVTSVSSDYDRKAGVVMFDGSVVVEYAGEYTMCADRVFVFASGEKELSSVVAIGNVSITNGVRYGTCDMAKYWRARNEIDMFSDGKGDDVKLVDRGDKPCELSGTRMRFWIDSEQVEVDNSKVRVDGIGKERLL